ncbi:OB-fold domain-containing protein [Thermomicrobiaceae bacterium CFH 74404]|uniref:OB-fold domain-containing protein n=1 Tax=Thermalbibacter longus TaxID=2951981 RepID=A0AA42BA17_9BACT|nr:OB-fold domain-containing protein [Thermalbibacter longus]MCM8747974.1 OB-fold domain-containing protein [Thermalbibacter longus]
MATVQLAPGTPGTVVSYTVIYVPTPEFADLAPYALAVIETSDGERLLGRVEDWQERPLAVGARVIFERADERGPVFRLA